MRENDVVFFNLHRKYINVEPTHGGFMGVYMLSAFLNDNGYTAQGYAGLLMRGKSLLDELCEYNLASMVGLYCDYDNVTENIFLSRYIKEKYNLPVIVGGPQATALRQDFYEKSLCDAVVCAEGELTVLELVECLLDDIGSLDDIKGIKYLKDGKLQINSDRQVIENLDKLPMITADDYIEPDHYSRSLSIMTGRGCPFHCAFCHEGHHTKKVRFRSVDSVLKEIKNYLDYFPDKKNIHVLFVDDTFTLMPDRVKSICDGLVDLCRDRELSWFCEAHVHTVYNHPEMIDYVAKAGCKRIQLGIEAGTQKVLDAFRKGSTLEEIETVVEKCRDAGIDEVFSNIILGGAHFTRDIFEQDKVFAKKLLSLGQGMLELGIVTYWPLPETSITDNPDEYGIKIVDGEFVTSAGDFPQIETAELIRLDLMNMQNEMYTEVIEHMKIMLLNHKVPHDRILSWMSCKYLSTGSWYSLLKTIPHMLAYYQMLSAGEAVRLDDLSDTEILEFNPMRTIGICTYTRVEGDGTILLVDNKLSRMEFDVLVHSLGKLSTKEIMYRLNIEEYARIKEILCKLGELYLIVFSKY